MVYGLVVEWLRSLFFICIIVKVVLTDCTAELLERLIIARAWLFLYKSIIYGSWTLQVSQEWSIMFALWKLSGRVTVPSSTPTMSSQQDSATKFIMGARNLLASLFHSDWSDLVFNKNITTSWVPIESSKGSFSSAVTRYCRWPYKLPGHLNPLLGPINWVTKKQGPGVRSGSVLLLMFVFTCVGLHRR